MIKKRLDRRAIEAKLEKLEERKSILYDPTHRVFDKIEDLISVAKGIECV